MVQLKCFGDSRDYFKYDLITHLLKSRVVSNYAFIPMLTNHRVDGEGNKTPKHIGGKSKELLSFIDRCDSKDLKHWECWLKPHIESYVTIHPVNEVFFEDEAREKYWESFDAVITTKNALIFVDPDTGLETGNPSYLKKRGIEKYILNEELRKLVYALDSSSVLMIYQHLPNNKHKHEESVLKKIKQAIKASRCSSVLAYREDNLAFLFISKSEAIFSELCKLLESYHENSGHVYKSMHYSHNHPIQIHGHRGARGLFPENSLIAIQAGIEAGCDAIEVDLCVTADNQLVIHHDLQLSSRLVRDASAQWVSGTIRIRDKTLKQLKTYDIGRINPDCEYAAQFPMQQAVDGTRIPSLDEFVTLVKACKRKVIYNLELKHSNDSKDIPAVPDYVDLVVQALKKHDIVERVFLQSFNRQLVMQVKAQLPKLKIGWITKAKAGILHTQTLESIVAGGLDVWSSNQQSLNAGKVRLAHDLGLEVYVWTVNSEQDMRRMIDAGVDAITTDYPNRLFDLLQNQKNGWR